MRALGSRLTPIQGGEAGPGVVGLPETDVFRHDPRNQLAGADGTGDPHCARKRFSNGF
jgi:hypothetical protein